MNIQLDSRGVSSSLDSLRAELKIILGLQIPQDNAMVKVKDKAPLTA